VGLAVEGRIDGEERDGGVGARDNAMSASQAGGSRLAGLCLAGLVTMSRRPKARVTRKPRPMNPTKTRIVVREKPSSSSGGMCFAAQPSPLPSRRRRVCVYHIATWQRTRRRWAS